MSRLFFVGLLLLAGPAVADDELDADLVDREPVNCVTVNRIKQTRIVDDNNILFFMRGGEVYRNYMPRRCPRLKRENSFTYDVRTNSLCNVDIIYVLERFGSSLRRGMACGLGMFYAVTKEEAEQLGKPLEDRIKVEDPKTDGDDPAR